MKVNLPNGYFFNVGASSFDVYYQPPLNEETGKERQAQLVGYCSSPETMLKRITQHYASRQEGEMGMTEFLMKWRAIYETFAGILRDHKLI